LTLTPPLNRGEEAGYMIIIRGLRWTAISCRWPTLTGRPVQTASSHSVAAHQWA